jgi:hypothetical protein
MNSMTKSQEREKRLFGYEVRVPIRLNNWADGHYVSDWSEGTLEPSDNVTLKSADKPPTRDWP